MKFKKNMFLEVSGQRISGLEFSRSKILNRVIKINKESKYYNMDINKLDIPDLKINIKNKNLYLLVEGETIYIKLVTLPLVKRYLINDMIENELRYYYKDINHIAFTYKLIKQDKTNMEILVFCLKGNSLDILESSCLNINIKKVNLIQFCFRDYYKSKINDRDFILVFYYNLNLYSLICHNYNIVANNIISINESIPFKFSCIMNEFLEQYNDYATICKKVYYANIEEIDIDKFTYLKLPHEILNGLNMEDLLKYIVMKG